METIKGRGLSKSEPFLSSNLTEKLKEIVPFISIVQLKLDLWIILIKMSPYFQISSLFNYCMGQEAAWNC